MIEVIIWFLIMLQVISVTVSIASMDGEFIGYAVGIGGTVLFFWSWYRKLSKMWPPDRNLFAKRVFGALPVAALTIIFFTLNNLASFDVTDSFTYAVIFYVPLGYAAIYLGLILISLCFDISWIDDAVNNANKAAVAAIAGGYIALALIYSGANVGDGPGWFTVVFAGGLGFAAWLLLWIIFDKMTGVFERVTVERDAYCGLRLGCYFIATGVILARASAGDWTDAAYTVIEFMDGWPVLPLMAAMLMAEHNLFKKVDYDFDTPEIVEHDGKKHLQLSILCGAASIVTAILLVLFVIRPVPENEYYDIMRNTPPLSREDVLLQTEAKILDPKVRKAVIRRLADPTDPLLADIARHFQMYGSIDDPEYKFLEDVLDYGLTIDVIREIMIRAYDQLESRYPTPEDTPQDTGANL